MVYSKTFAICLLIVLAYNLVAGSNNEAEFDSNVDVAVVESLDEYLEQNPEIKLLQELEAEEEDSLASRVSPKLQINYKVGNRISGDRLLATAKGYQSWGSPQDVTQSLSYPKAGVGSVVTFVQVTIDQSTNLGRAFVTSGGIGQRQITIVIEAKTTFYFQYLAQIYGY